MDFRIMHITLFGQVVILFLTVTTTCFWLRNKSTRLFATVFPLFTIVESIYVGWRWDRTELYDTALKHVWAGMPSFLIAVGFPFVGFYLHHIISSRWKEIFAEQNIFPFTRNDSPERRNINAYFQRGIWYSFTTLVLHEASQYYNISKRNTFDPIDFLAIAVGSLLSVLVFGALKKNLNTDNSFK